MTVLVNPAINVNPVANAGIDQTKTYPTTTASLSGSGTDSDGTIVGYLWTQVGGTAATITSATSAATTVTGLVAGVYQFQLKVTSLLILVLLIAIFDRCLYILSLKYADTKLSKN